MKQRLKSEPALTVGGAAAVAAAVLAVLTSFGVLSMDAAQQKAVLGVIGAVAPIVAAVITRKKVTPVVAPEKEAQP